MEPKKAVKIIAILILVFSIFGLLENLAILLLAILSESSPLLTEVFAEAGYTMSRIVITMLLSMIIGFLVIISSIGLLKYKEWARKLMIILIVLNLLLGLGSVLFATSKNIYIILITYIFTLIIWGLVLYYFTRPRVKKVFRS